LDAPDDFIDQLVRRQRLYRLALERGVNTDRLTQTYRDWLAWLDAQLPSVDGYAQESAQRLKVILDLARGVEVTDVLDALAELGKRAVAAHRDADAALMNRVIVTLGERANVAPGRNRVLDLAQAAASGAEATEPTAATRRFIEQLAEIANLSPSYLLASR
jgi:hypothetical protein